MRKFLRSKLFILLLTIFIMNLVTTYSGQSQVYARRSEKDIKSTKQSEPITARYYIVSLDGLGNFTSIQEAASYAQNGDTLIIYPGIYTENLEITDKALNIIGVDKDSCILQYDTISYFKVPLTIAAGSVSNLTIYGMNNGTQQETFFDDEYITVNETESPEGLILKAIREHQKNHTGYAIHIDENFLYEKEIKFQNCKIISENNHCVGIGSRGNSKIIFENCEIISTGNGGCIFLHDCQLPEYQGKVDFTMKNCQLTSYLNPYVMTIDSLGPFNPTYLTFQNIKVSAVAFDESECYVSNNINTGFDVDSLMLLDNSNQLEAAGFTSTAMHNLVHELSMKESNQYIETISTLFEHKNPTVNYNILPEGITYIKAHNKTNAGFEIASINGIKKSVLNFQNASLQSGTGWYGLDNVYLTQDSYGNTLIEMNQININDLVPEEEQDILVNVVETIPHTEIENVEEYIPEKVTQNEEIEENVSKPRTSNEETFTQISKEGKNYVIIPVERGNGSEIVSRRLYNAGLVDSAVEYDRYLIKNGYDRIIKVGKHEIPTDATEEEIAQILCRMR